MMDANAHIKNYKQGNENRTNQNGQLLINLVEAMELKILNSKNDITL